MRKNLKPVFVSKDGGTLDVCDRETGEIVVSVPVRPGVVSRGEFAALEEVGEFRLSKGLIEVPPFRGYVVQPAIERYVSGANPDYTPPPAADRLHNEMRQMVNRLARQEKTIAAMQRAPERLREMPVAPKPAPQPVVEPVEPEAAAPDAKQ